MQAIASHETMGSSYARSFADIIMFALLKTGSLPKAQQLLIIIITERLAASDEDEGTGHFDPDDWAALREPDQLEFAKKLAKLNIGSRSVPASKYPAASSLASELVKYLKENAIRECH